MFHCSVSLEGSDTVLYLQPGDKKVIKAAGEDTSWFVSCRGDTGDKLLWSHLTSGMDTWDTSGYLDPLNKRHTYMNKEMKLVF